MRNRYQIFFFLHCICLFVQLILIDHFPLSVSTRSFEFDMFFASSSLKHCNTEMHLPKIAPVVFGPFFFFFWECRSLSDGSMHSGADAVAFPQGDGCCGVYKATQWHLHKKEWMLLGQGGKKRWGRNSSTAVITPSSLMLLDSHFAPPAVVQRWYMKHFLCNICNSSRQRNRGDDICQRTSTSTGGRLMNRFK